MALSRNRVRDSSPAIGIGTYLGYPEVWYRAGDRKVSTDVIGDFGGNHSLFIGSKQVRGSRVVLQTVSNIRTQIDPELGLPTQLHDFNQSNWTNDFGYQPTLDSYVNRLLAQTGPLTPNVQLPLALFELRDVPRMLRHAGDLLHKIRSLPYRYLDPVKEAAAANLAYKFGWEPIASDLSKLLGFAEAVKRRQQQIRKANTDRGLRRKVHLDSFSMPHSGNLTIWSTHGLYLSPSYEGIVTSETWGTVRWRVRDPNAYGTTPSFTEAGKINLGLQGGQIPIQLWKAFPWTWMIDWFADVSNILQANYNSVYYEPYRLSVMRTTVDKFGHKQIPLGGPNDYLTEGEYVATFKQRYANNAPSTHWTLKLPFLDNYKLSVLGSLAVLGASPRGR